MEPPLLSSIHPELLGELPLMHNAPLVVVHWSKFGTHRLYVDTAEGEHVGWVDLKTGRHSLAMPELAHAFELAVTEAKDARAADLAQDGLADELEVSAADQADGEPALMRHAYRGKSAYSSWDLGPGGNRLVEDELNQLVSVDPHLAYLSADSVR